jgi:hypothetical protein
MANLTYTEKLTLYTTSLDRLVYHYVADYTFEHQCTLIKALLELLENAMEDSEYELVNEEEKTNITRIIEGAKAILKPFNI